MENLDGDVTDGVTNAECAFAEEEFAEELQLLNQEYEQLIDSGVAPDLVEILFGLRDADFPIPVPVPEPTPALSYAFGELDRIVTDLEQIERQLGALHARRVEVLAKAEVWAQNAAETGVVHGESLSEREDFAHRTAVAELAAAVHQSERTIARHLTDAHQLIRLAETTGALREGRISLSHARIIAAACASVPVAKRDDLEQALLPIALVKAPAILGRKARSIREKLHPIPVEERHGEARSTRQVSFEPDLDGMAWLHQHGPAADLLREYETLTTLATAMISCGDMRTLNQLRCDLLADLILDGSIGDKLDRLDRGGAPEDGTLKRRKRVRRSARPRVLVTVPVLTLLGGSDEPAILDGYGPIDADTARRLTAEAPSFHRLLTHPVTGAVLKLDRTIYRVPADLRRWVQARDGTCRAPGCNRPAIGTDLDHTIDWACEGETAGHNLASLCRSDHVKKHALGWKVTQDGEGNLTWLSPTRRRYRTEPEITHTHPGKTDATPEPPPF